MICDVSVVIPNYNRTKLLWKALKSVVDQTLQPSEVIVIDDCSSAANIAEISSIIELFRDRLQISLLVNTRNSGANYSRNRGIFSATSKYIAFLDSDDLWMPDKLKLQMAEIEKARMKDSRPILSGTGRYRIGANGHVIARQFGGKLLNPNKIRRSNFIGTLSSIVVETWVARHVHGFNESLPACQDWDFFIRVADYVQYVGVREPLCVYVDHDEERITLNNKKRLRAHLFIYKNHIRDFGQANTASRAEFYRNVAEDYQTLGNQRKADLFYAKFRSLRSPGLGLLRIPSAFWFCLYRHHGAPAIKAKRYAAYKRSLAGLNRKAKQREKIGNDSVVINQMMAAVEYANHKAED